MNDRRDNYRDRRSDTRRPRPRPVLEFKEIEAWRLIRNIADRARESGKSYVELCIDMERPEFKDHTLGYYRLNTLIVVDERSSLRLNTSALGILRRFFQEHDEDIEDAIAEVRRKNARIDERLLEEESQNRFQGLDEDQDSAPPVRDVDVDEEGEEGDDCSPDDVHGEESNQPVPQSTGETQSRRRTRRAP